MNYSAGILIPEIRRVTSLIPNQDSDAAGVFRLTERVTREPRRIRKRQLIDAWRKSSLSRGLAEPSLALQLPKVVEEQPTIKGASPFKWELTEMQRQPEPVSALSSLNSIKKPMLISSCIKFTDKEILGRTPNEIVDIICKPPEIKIDVAQRRKTFGRKFKIRSSTRPLPQEETDTISTVTSTSSLFSDVSSTW